MITEGLWLVKLILSHLVTDFVFQPTSWVRDREKRHFSSSVLTAVVFLTSPAGILIGQLTSQWSRRVDDPENSLTNAGKWIGIVERVIVFILVLHEQYSAIGLLIAAKGIIRFNEKDRQEVKTEYLVIGTLVSLATAIIVGLVTKRLG